jgi:2,3-bisphosphoglycerate-dependent phosphoglycerate mutase
VELILIRHGLPLRTGDHPNGVGAAPDPDLSPTGREQARLVAEWLAHEPISAIYSSPMRRAHQTAEPLAAAFGQSITIDEGLREIHFGETAYVPMEDLASDDPAAQWWRDRMADQTTELVTAFRAQVADAVTRIIARHPGETVAVTCHGGVVNAALSSLLGARDTFNFEIDYTAVSRVLASRGGVQKVHSVNDTGHLRVPGGVAAG